MSNDETVPTEPTQPGHGSDCACTRCLGFQPGNLAALKTGVYSARVVAPRAAEILEELLEQVPVRAEESRGVLEALAVMMARRERVSAAIDEVEAELQAQGASLAELHSGPVAAKLAEPRRLERSWTSQVLRLSLEAGVTPASYLRMSRDASATGLMAAKTAEIVEPGAYLALQEALRQRALGAAGALSGEPDQGSSVESGEE